MKIAKCSCVEAWLLKSQLHQIEKITLLWWKSNLIKFRNQLMNIHIQNWEKLNHSLITQVQSIVLPNWRANITELHIRLLKIHIILIKNQMVCRLLPPWHVESSYGDGGGVVFLSFTAAGHPRHLHSHHSFRRRASAQPAFLSATGPDWICSSKFISCGIQIKQVLWSN
jgi:hypothetical protein